MLAEYLVIIVGTSNLGLTNWAAFPGKSCLTDMSPKTWSAWESDGVVTRFEECRQQCLNSMLCGAAEIRFAFSNH